MTKANKDIIDYVVLYVGAFSERFRLSNRQAYQYLHRFGGISFLIDFYDVEHTQSIEDAVDDCALICRRHGGALQP